MDSKTQYMFEIHKKKFIVFMFYGYFSELLSTDLEFQGDLQ